MDVEHLSKTQIILLVLLCTFVASIATGIVTVSLLAQAPPGVTQTVNHIIQRTVEAVAPTTSDTPATTVKETTVVVKEDELLSATITASFAKIGSVHEGIGTTTPVVALGTVVGNYLLTDSSVVTEKHIVSFGDVSALYTVKVKYSAVGIAVLTPDKTATAPQGFRIADVAQARLGQSVVTLPSAAGTRVGIGSIVARYTLGRVGDADQAVPIRAIETNIGGSVTPGAPLLNAFGDVLGIATGISQGPAGSTGTFVALSDLAPLFLSVKGTSTPAVAEEVSTSL